MTDINEVIFSRRSVRWFKQDPLPDDDIKEIISAGLRAPNAGGAQQWKFVVVTSDDMRKKILYYIKKGQMNYLLKMSRNPPDRNEIAKREDMLSRGMYDAPAYIIGMVDYSNRTLNDEYIKYERLWGFESVTLAMGNMMLLAWSKGYGTVFLTVPQLYEEDLKESLELPGNLEFVGIMAIGKPAEMPELTPRKPLSVTVIYK